MATLDLTAFDAVLKDYYTEEKVKDLTLAKHPLYAMMGRKQKGGRKYIQPVDFALPGNASASFANAKTNQSVSLYEDFQIPRVKQYQLVTLENEVIEASMENDEAFLNAFDEFDKGFKSLGEKFSRQLFRSRGGAIGRFAATVVVGTNTATLTDAADAFNFQKNQVLNLASTDGTSGAIHVGTLTVATVNRTDGIITFTGNITAGVAAAAASDWIFPVGDFGACLYGLADWLPAGSGRAAALAASFAAVTRDQDSDRLGGIYYDGTGEALDEALISLCTLVCQNGGAPDAAFMNPVNMASLMKLWNAKRTVYEPVSKLVTPTIGFAGFKVNCGGEDMTIYTDRACPSNRVFALQMDTWRLWHAGDLPGFLAKRAGSILRVVEDADSYEARVGAYLNLGCSAPGFNGVMAV